MNHNRRLSGAIGAFLAITVLGQVSSVHAQAASTTPPAVAQPALAPATKLEAFKTAAGSVVTFGYNELGRVGGILSGVSVDVRELRDGQGAAVRGLVVEVREGEYKV